jgi:hypothetical protein
MWEEAMAQVAREQEVLEARIGEAEEKRKLTKRALREVIEGGVTISRPESRAEQNDEPEEEEQVSLPTDDKASRRRSTARNSIRRRSALMEVTNMSDSETEEDDEEFFDAVDAGEVEIVRRMPPSSPPPPKQPVPTISEVDGVLDLSSSFKGYENGIRKRLKMDADDRPKISLWVSRRIVLILIGLLIMY